MLPDGSINPGQMTSFNHYALGSVCHFLHSYVAGLSPTSPGWKTALVKPRPGGTIKWAKAEYDSPIGPYSVSWELADGKMKTQVTVPPNGEARVMLAGVDMVVQSGRYKYETVWSERSDWAPKPIQGAQGQEVPDFYVN
jgi:alpha-L-rhamnosidase